MLDYGIFFAIWVPLGQDCPYTNITRICVKNEREGVVWVSQNWGRGQLVFQQVKGMLAFFGPLQHGRFLCKTVEGFCNVGIVLYKPTVEICQPQELLDVAFGDWYWPRCYPFGFFWVSCNAHWGDVSEVCWHSLHLAG